MSLRLRRGTDAQRQTVTLDQGELVYTTDTLKVFVGDGVTSGGNNIGKALAGNGLYFDSISQTLQCPSAGITGVVADTAPSLGGNLNLNSHNIIGTGTINYSGIFNNSAVRIDTGGIVSPQGSLTQLNIYGGLGQYITFTSATDGTSSNFPAITLQSSRGFAAAPTTLLANDFVSQISFKGYNGTGYTYLGGILSELTSTSNMSNSHPGVNIAVLTGNNNSGVNAYTFTSTGIFNSPILQTTTYTSGTIPSAVTMGVGARAFVTDATSVTFNATYVGGSTSNVPVFSDGSVWRIG
jgi:hypothetical protein